MALSWVVSLVCITLDTVRIPSAVPIRPDTAVLKAVLVRVRMLVVIRARKQRPRSDSENGVFGVFMVFFRSLKIFFQGVLMVQVT